MIWCVVGRHAQEPSVCDVSVVGVPLAMSVVHMHGRSKNCVLNKGNGHLYVWLWHLYMHI